MLESLNSEIATKPAGWRARLDLEFDQRAGVTYLSKRQHVGPLLVQRPFFPEPRSCHVYIVHPPGGVVGGDDLTIAVRTKLGAHALVTTPAATKFYRCDGRSSRQVQSLEVEEGILEWLPQETIFFPEALARSATVVRLDRASRFIGWEIPCLGLPVRGEPFDRGRLALDMEIWVDGSPRFIDHLRLDGASDARKAMWGFAGFEALGTLLAYPASAPMLDAVRSLEIADGEMASTIVDGVLVCRCLAAQAERVKHTFIAAWQRLRPLLLGREAVMPRIWAT